MRPRRILAALATTSVLLTVAAVVVAMNREYLPGMQWPEPPIITPGADGSPPSDAIVLFDGKDLSAWEPSDTWKVGDGFFTEGRGDIHTKQNFGDIQLHIEWSSPNPPRGHDQDRGNSGVFFQDRYELQVLDSYDNTTYYEGQAGAIYKQTPPMVNAMRPPGEWNVYDVVWTAPRFNDDGPLKSPAYVTALQNGVLILNHFAVLGDTPWHSVPKYEAHGPAPLRLQDHGHPVRFRNIWVRELHPLEGKRVAEPKFHDHDSGKEWLVSEGEEPPATTNIAGEVTVDGKPLPNATISFFPSNDRTKTPVFRTSVKDGKFQITNATPGKYVVSVPSSDSTPIAAKYKDPNVSGLTVELREGSNALTFDLKSK